MRRASLPGLDLGVYAKAVPLLLRNPAIAVVPLLMAVVGVLVGLAMTPYGGGVIGAQTSGLAGFITWLLQLFGLGAACVMADDAWRHGRASFDKGWNEARRRGGDILFASIGVSLLLAVAQYMSILIGQIALLLLAVVALFLIWAIPAAAIGGVPGGAAIQASIDRVRANPVPAALAAVVAVALVVFAAPYLAIHVAIWLLPYTGGSTLAIALLNALFQAIAVAYVALIVTKTYTDASFTRRW
jgi:hypothetical protein